MDHQQLTSTQFILQMLQKAKEKLEQAAESGVEEVCVCVCVCVDTPNTLLEHGSLVVIVCVITVSSSPSLSLPPLIRV